MNRFLSIALIAIVSCTNTDLKSKAEFQNNSDLISSINEFKFTESVFEVVVDSLGNISDTLTVKKIKKNRKGQILYYEKNRNRTHDSSTLRNYYRENEDLFYQEYESNNDLKTIYETTINSNGDITNATMISTEDGDISLNDTLNMSFEYHLDSVEIKTKLLILAEFDSTNSRRSINYNSLEQKIDELQTVNDDTTEIIKYEYLKDKLHKKTHRNFHLRTFEITYFDLNEEISKIEEFYANMENLEKLKETLLAHDNVGNVIGYIEKDVESGDMRRVKYFRE